MLDVSSADAICSAIKMTPFEIIKGRSTRILLSVECLKTGQMACIADKNGNIGTGNKGKNNFGDYNDGNNNIGSYNKGNSNWGDRNKGTNLRCNDATGTRKVVNTCNLKGIRSSG
ncbi:hypothetical protein APUTEX25_002691, partial [Auxenochlorella protothecoides]